jgi:hypothetical protein
LEELCEQLLDQCIVQQKGIIGMRLEETFLVDPTECRDCDFANIADRIVARHRKVWNLLMTQGAVISFDSEEFWGRVHRLLVQWTAVLKLLAKERLESPIGALSMPQVAAATVVDSLMELLYYGSECAVTRKLLTACGMQKLLDEDIAAIPQDLIKADGSLESQALPH